MPEFVNPFPGMVHREMTHGELVRAIMLDIAAEYEAVHLYLAHMDATSNEDAKKVLYDVAIEELVHVGEFTSLLYRLDSSAAERAREGFEEVSHLLSSKAPATPAEGGEEPAASPDEAAHAHGLTVGSLMGKSGG